MTISYPYSLAQLADRLKIESVVWDIKRNDEMSGSGDARVWAVELAAPLWLPTITLAPVYNDEAKQIAAIIRKLQGSQEAFFLYDPLSKYPQFDPSGSVLGSNVVTVVSIASNRGSLALQGLPPNYRLTVGDKLSISFGSSPVKFAFLEVSETITANASGATSQIAVFPFVPTGVAADAEVILKKPACKCIVLPNGHSPGTAAGMITAGAIIKAIQKK